MHAFPYEHACEHQMNPGAAAPVHRALLHFSPRNPLTCGCEGVRHTCTHAHMHNGMTSHMLQSNTEMIEREFNTRRHRSNALTHAQTTHVYPTCLVRTQQSTAPGRVRAGRGTPYSCMVAVPLSSTAAYEERRKRRLSTNHTSSLHKRDKDRKGRKLEGGLHIGHC